MTKNTVVKHEIQKYILSILILQKFARFRDMRPPKIDTNLYSYHLKLLVRDGYIAKTNDGYTLSMKGIQYADNNHDENAESYVQPKIVTMLVIQNGYGDVLMRKRMRQPFIDRWTLPQGEIRSDDHSLLAATQREIQEEVGNVDIAVSHAGDCYIRVTQGGDVKMTTLAHVFYGTTSGVIEDEHFAWVSPHKIDTIETSPAIAHIVARTFFRDPYFFEEYMINW